jgi:hypothetical protein
MKKLLKTLLITLLTSLSASVAAAPVGFSINSDSPGDNADSLYRIDLATGVETRVATVKALGQVRIDVEGMAFAEDGTLYAVDDDTLTFFPLNPDNAVVDVAHEKTIKGLPVGGTNDFGLSFACDGNLYLTSTARASLYRMDLDGNLTVVGGAEGKLNPVNISAVAAYGDPVRLYGLGNGADKDGIEETPNLYELDLATGTANLVGPLGGAAGPYLQGGLAFDDDGQLWAVTEGALFGWPSQIMKIDRVTGAASEVRTLSETGFESLAITVPRGCDGDGGGETATFTVQKQYLDGNDETPVTLNIRCNTGLPLEQSTTVVPNPGPFGKFEVNFTVASFADGALNCEVWESAPTSYTPSYECFSTGSCAVTENECRFTAVTADQENLCAIRNYPDPVLIEVNKDWADSRMGLEVEHRARIELTCTNPYDGDGEWVNGTMRWSWEFEDGTAVQTATVYPRFDGSTQCRTVEQVSSSAIESIGTCSEWTPVALGAGSLACTVTNTIFFEGIPALNPLGLVIASLLLLLTGLFAARRF